MKKRILSLGLALCLGWGLLAVPAGASPADLAGLTAEEAQTVLEQIDAHLAELPRPYLADVEVGYTGAHALLHRTPAGEWVLFMSKGYVMGGRQEPDVWEDGRVCYDLGEAAAWLLRDGQMVRVAPRDNGEAHTLYPNYLEVAGGAPDGSHTEYRFYSFDAAASPQEPAATFVSDRDDMGRSAYTVDGAAVTEQVFAERLNAWETGAVAEAYHGGGVEYFVEDIPPAAETRGELKKVAKLAFPSTQPVEIDGDRYEFSMYALKDDKGNQTNYVRVRDFARIMNQRTAQRFNVTWNGARGAVDIVRGEDYVPDGSELSTPFSGRRVYETPELVTLVDGEAVSLETFTLTDDAGGGYTYYKLRDLGAALGFTVDWSAQRGITIETE